MPSTRGRHKRLRVRVFSRYGPNAIKVDAYVRALSDLTSEEFSRIDHDGVDIARLQSLAEKVGKFEDERLEERQNALHDANEAVKGKGSELQVGLAALFAMLLVMDDFLNRDEKSFLSLYLVNPLVPLHVLYEGYQKEDLAIEAFCEQLSLVDGQNVHMKKRLDDRGRAGAGLPDFVIERGGVDYTVEHTSLNSYQGQVHYEVLWKKFFEPLNIKHKIEDAYPGKLIRIAIPINAFRSEGQAGQFDFDKFIEDLIEAVGKTPESHNGSKEVAYIFQNTPFTVYISKEEKFTQRVLLLELCRPTQRSLRATCRTRL